MSAGGTNGHHHPKGEAWGSKLPASSSGGGKSGSERGGCLPMLIAVIVLMIVIAIGPAA